MRKSHFHSSHEGRRSGRAETLTQDQEGDWTKRQKWRRQDKCQHAVWVAGRRKCHLFITVGFGPPFIHLPNVLPRALFSQSDHSSTCELQLSLSPSLVYSPSHCYIPISLLLSSRSLSFWFLISPRAGSVFFNIWWAFVHKLTSSIPSRCTWMIVLISENLVSVNKQLFVSFLIKEAFTLKCEPLWILTYSISQMWIRLLRQVTGNQTWFYTL